MSPFHVNYARGLFEIADRLGGPPEDDPWHKYVLGVVAPAGAIVYAIRYFSADEAWGWLAFVILVALFVHVHYFWSVTAGLYRFAELVKNLLALPLIGLILYAGYTLATQRW